MKKNKLTRLAILVLALAIGSMMIVSGTYAKYTSSITGTATGSVAKWSWTIGSDDITTVAEASTGFSFDLFDTILDSDISTAEDDVDDDLIAPGTSGLFEISLTNNSEVNATYAIALEETSNTSNIPIEYSLDGTDNSWTDDVTDLNATTADIDMGDTETLSVYWRWAFTGAESESFTSTQTDVSDTALGFAANTSRPTVTVTGTITVTQVD